jgi:hypothetical protein
VSCAHMRVVGMGGGVSFRTATPALASTCSTGARSSAKDLRCRTAAASRSSRTAPSTAASSATGCSRARARGRSPTATATRGAGSGASATAGGCALRCLLGSAQRPVPLTGARLCWRALGGGAAAVAHHLHRQRCRVVAQRRPRACPLAPLLSRLSPAAEPGGCSCARCSTRATGRPAPRFAKAFLRMPMASSSE